LGRREGGRLTRERRLAGWQTARSAPQGARSAAHPRAASDIGANRAAAPISAAALPAVERSRPSAGTHRAASANKNRDRDDWQKSAAPDNLPAPLFPALRRVHE